MLLPTVTRFSALRTIPRFLERKLGKELSAKLRFASAPIRNSSVGVTLCAAPAFLFSRLFLPGFGSNRSLH